MAEHARGGSGVILRARDARLDRAIAIKELRSGQVRIVSAVRASFLKGTFFMAPCRASGASDLGRYLPRNTANPLSPDARCDASMSTQAAIACDVPGGCRIGPAEPSGVRDTPSAW
jgi:hypothetical protein